jgi:hypothetical protein
MNEMALDKVPGIGLPFLALLTYLLSLISLLWASAAFYAMEYELVASGSYL